MRVWLVKDLEPIPTDSDSPRMLRAGSLARALTDAGHEVTWFTSTFNHYTKKHRKPQYYETSDGMKIIALKGVGYVSHISLRRYAHNVAFAAMLNRKMASMDTMPDVILTDLPTPEAAAVAVRFGKVHDIPTVLSIRDKWPDFFSEFAPNSLAHLVDLVLWPMRKTTQYACVNASSIIGISHDYLKWGLNKAGRASCSADAVFHLGYAKTKADGPNLPKQFSSLSSKKCVVSFVGTWGKTYDMEAVVDLCKKHRDDQDTAFVICGDYETLPAVYEALSAFPNVILPGWLDRFEIAQLLNRTHVGLLPYTQRSPQGLPNKFFEYVSFGVYQVSSIKGEMADEYANWPVIGVTAPGSTFIDAVDNAITNAKANAINRAAILAVAQKHFNNDKIFANLVKHIEAIALKPN